MAAILAVSRRNNERSGVTGALLYASGIFAQVLEGPAESVQRAFETIRQDTRHRSVVVLLQGLAIERTFPHWAMGILRSVDERIDIVGLLESAFSKPSEDIGLAVRRLLVQSEAESKIIGTLWLC